MIILEFRRQPCLIFLISLFFLPKKMEAQSADASFLMPLFKVKNELISKISLVNQNPIDNYDSLNLTTLNPKIELLHNKGELYALIKGTGKLYKIDSTLHPIRIDRSVFAGATFGASNFIYNDTIYSIGGYGFWNINGAIRFFNSRTAEWDIIRTNQNVPFANGINSNYFIDYKNAKFYLLYNNPSPEYIENKVLKNNICYVKILDLKTKKWEKALYTISGDLAQNFSDLSFIQIIGGSIIANSKYRSNALLINFSENSIKEIKDARFTEWIQINNNIKSGIIYNINDTVYLVNEKDNKIEKFILSKNDIKSTNEQFYKKSNVLLSTEWYIIIGLSAFFCIVILLLINYYVKYKKAIRLTRNDKIYTIEADKRTINEFVETLTVLEREVLELIVKNNWNGLTTSVTQLNRVLGTEKKNDKIQNNIRGEIILELNNKFKIYSLLNDDLIERKKSSFDKRHIEYFISDKMINKIPKKLFS